MALPPVLNRIIAWLRAGYPEGVPDVDYIPLFALLGSQLTESEVKEIAEELANGSKPGSAEAIRKAIEAVTDHKPSDADVARVRARLAAGGWPLARPTAQPENVLGLVGKYISRILVPEPPHYDVHRNCT